MKITSSFFALLVFMSVISQISMAQNDKVKPVSKTHRVGLITNVLNNDRLVGTYFEIGFSYEGHISGTVSSATHITYLTNSVAKGIVVRPEIRFYLKEYKSVLDQGFYISLGGNFGFIEGAGFPGVDSSNHVNLYRLGLTGGVGYQYNFDNNIFVNIGVVSGLGVGLYQLAGSQLSSNLWYSENNTHPLISQLTAIFRVGYAF
jgi:hypothetical protein